MKPEHRDLARHALGLSRGRKVSYRNYFVASPGSQDHIHWQQMVLDGTAFKGRWRPEICRDDLFHLTPVGANAALNKGERLDPEDFPAASAA